MTIKEFNSRNHRYIYYINAIRNTYGNGYAITGKAGYRQYYGYQFREAIAMYNSMAKEARA